MRALFLADAHLCRPHDPNYRALLAFLEQERGHIDRLVLLGDIFEFWIGKDQPSEDARPLIEAFEALRRAGTELIYVEGNHDFHLGPVFSERLGCRILPDGGPVEMDGLRIYLAHGDLANPEDTGYRRLRRLLRGGLVRVLIRTLPNGLLNLLARRAGYESRRSAGEKRRRWPAREILRPYAEALLAAGNQVVITGHYHEPFRLKLEGGELIALGDWIDQYSYALFDGGRFTLNRYSPSD